MYTVIVIDDSTSMRRILKDIINSIDEFEVVDEAIDAYDAREKIKYHEPDLVTIDINMPKMDGVTFLRNLMRLHPMPAVVISGEGARGNDIFDDGAVGFIEKPGTGELMSSFQNRVKDNLLNLTFLLKIYTTKKPKPKKKPTVSTKSLEVERKNDPDVLLRSNPARLGGPKVIAIGSSTGGVESLLTVFSALPSDLPPIVITQHIPYGFSRSFAQRLNSQSKLDVYEATDGMKLENGKAFLAPGNMHLTIEKRYDGYYTKLLDGPRISHHKPSVNIMFRSVNNEIGSSAMGVMMTGMGDDGMIAMKEMYDNGAYTVAQNEETCVVFGMPKKAIEIGAVKDIIPLTDIAQYIIEFSNNRRR